MSKQWDKIYHKLLQDGFDVYSPGIKTGECKKPYVVVKEDGGNRVLGISTVIDYYSVMCYVPFDSYSTISEFVESVEKSLHGLQPEIVSTNTKTPSFYDDSVKAHMISLQYRNYKKIYGIID